MRAWRELFATATMISFAAIAQDLPTHEGEGPALEIDPPLLIQARNADGSFVLAGPAATPAPPQDIAKLEKDLTRAKRNASGADHLYRIGAISKVDAEERVLRVVRLEARLAEARLELAKRDAEQREASEDEAGQETNIAQAEEAAARAAAEKKRAEIEAAFRNLQRQQKLLALGSGHKSDVNRAEQKLAELQRANE